MSQLQAMGFRLELQSEILYSLIILGKVVIHQTGTDKATNINIPAH